MEKLGVPAKITRMIRACVQNPKCMVKFNGQLSKAFMINTGLKQGDALSPILFNIALEVVRNALNTGIGVKLQESKTIKLIAYTDDIVLLSESESDFQSMTESLMDESKQMDLTINGEKTKGFGHNSYYEKQKDKLGRGYMARSRVDNWSSHLLEAEEQKTTRPPKTKMGR
ncbi:hypothetical protein QTP88_021942 [Uroleucon formosanum]